MLENILLGNSPGIYSGLPLLGYNFDKQRSVGKVVTTADRAMDSRVDFGVGGELPDYKGGVRLLNKLCKLGPATGMSTVGTGNYTVEFYFWLSTYPNNYTQMFNLQTATGMIYLGFTDSGWGYRLHLMVGDVSQASNNNTYYCASLTAAQAANKWHHIAIVRRGGMVKLYIDGVPQMLAQGPASYTYNIAAVPSPVSFGTMNTFQFGYTYSNTDVYCPEMLIYDVAKYSKAFTPPKGPIAPLT